MEELFPGLRLADTALGSGSVEKKPNKQKNQQVKNNLFSPYFHKMFNFLSLKETSIASHSYEKEIFAVNHWS